MEPSTPLNTKYIYSNKKWEKNHSSSTVNNFFSMEHSIWDENNSELKSLRDEKVVEIKIKSRKIIIDYYSPEWVLIKRKWTTVMVLNFGSLRLAKNGNLLKLNVKLNEKYRNISTGWGVVERMNRVSTKVPNLINARFLTPCCLASRQKGLETSKKHFMNPKLSNP